MRSAAEAALRMSSSVTMAGTGRPRLCWEYSVCFHSIHARQSCGAWGIGEPTGGGGDVGGGGELHFPSTEEIEGEGEGIREDAADSRAARASARVIAPAIISSVDIGGGAVTSVKEQARGMTGSAPRVPGASEEGLGRTSPLSLSFPAPASDAGVLPEGFPVLGGGGFGSGRGASTAISLAGCFSPDLRLHDLVRGFAALQALKKPGEVPGALRTSRIKVNITSFILARGRDLVTGTSFRALLTR